ncbi:MAG: AGE family epimerase/isomerase [Clostridia bacterium]|nr:AGE family epimerase/isomerase [Clostridia bacterium]
MKTKFREYYKQYLNTLENEVMPFWLKNAIDASGAINNCIDEDGTVLSKERYIWSQGRALWTFSALYNRIEKKQEYLDVATGLFNYLLKTGRDENGKWLYRFDENGNVLDGDISIYVDGFVLIGMTEYYVATGDERAKQIAYETYKNTYRRINTPGSYSVAPYVIPEGMKTHGVNMIFSYFYYQLGKAINDIEICYIGQKLALEVLNQFYVKDKDAILEFVTLDGEFVDIPEGRACVPGHAIECMWFLISIFEDRGEKEYIDKCINIIRRHIELAEDKEKGGLILALDIDGKEPCFWGKPTYKPWWVQLETLVATLYAYKHTGDEWFADVHKRLNKFVYENYPSGHGEWYNWLDNDGNVGESAALPVKDPFHLPRALMMMIELLKPEDDKKKLDIKEVDTNFQVTKDFQKGNMKFYDVDEAPFKVYGLIREDGYYRRMPNDVAKSVSPGVHWLHTNTAGGRIRFMTDSDYVIVHAEMENMSKMSHFPYTGSAGMDIYVNEDGTQNYWGTFVPGLEDTLGFDSIKDFGTRKMRDITINMPLYSDVKKVYVALADDAEVKEAPLYYNDKPVVYYGSSITQGGCASRAGMAYQAIVSRRFNQDFVNLGFSGNGKAEDEMIDYIKNLEMSMFVMDYDHNSPTVEHLEETHPKLFNAVRENHPDIPIIMMSRPRIILTEDEEKRLQIVKNTYDTAVAGGDKNVYFIPGTELLGDARDEGLVDRCHPTDLGFWNMAKRLGDEMEKILK